MNRTTLFGIALFFAVLGIAVMGSDNQANAGRHGCAGISRSHGGCFGGLFKHRRACHGVTRGCAGTVACGGAKRCHGGLLARLRARHSCGGAATTCCGEVAAPVCEPTCCAPAACEPACGAPAPCGNCGGCGGCEPSCGGAVMEGTPIESAPIEVAPTEAEVAPEVPPAPAAEEAEGSA